MVMMIIIMIVIIIATIVIIFIIESCKHVPVASRAPVPNMTAPKTRSAHHNLTATPVFVLASPYCKFGHRKLR